jgi:hypothetical protein
VASRARHVGRGAEGSDRLEPVTGFRS